MYGTNENPGLAPRWFLSVRVEPGLWIFNGFRSLGFGGFGLRCEASVEIDKKNSQKSRQVSVQGQSTSDSPKVDAASLAQALDTMVVAQQLPKTTWPRL